MPDVILVNRVITVTVPNTVEYSVETDSPERTVETTQTTQRTVETGQQGPAGPQGEPGPAGAVTLTRTATTLLGGHRIVRSITASTVEYASNDNPLHGDDTLGLTLGAGADLTIQTTASVTHNGWTWTPGAPVFLGTNGLLTQTAPDPDVAAFQQVIGFAEAADTLFLNIQPAIYF